MLRYWRKEVGGEVWLPDGKKVQAEFEHNGDGFISTGVGYLNHQLGLAAQQGIGGISELTKEQFDEVVKKKSMQQESPNQRRNNLYRANQPLNQTRNAAGAGKASSIEVPVPPKPDPIRVPTADQMKPRRGPIPKEAFI